MHYLTGKHLPRRTFLRGLGATVALPALDAMIPAGRPWRDLATDPGRTRLICMEEPMGTAGASVWGAGQNLFAPATAGRDFELGTLNQLAPLIDDFREWLTVVSNTDCRMAEPYSSTEVGGDHDRSASVLLTQAHPKQTQGSDLYLGQSLDQLHARRFGQDTVLPSLEMAIEEGDQAGGCNYNYHCAYRHVISWASPNEPLPAIRNPRTVFERLFGAGDSSADRIARRRAQGSMLDWVMGEVARIQRDLAAVDRVAMDGYLSQVREIERRIQLVEAANGSGEARELPEAPQGVPDSWQEHMQIMFDLQVLALQSDITRVISLKLGLEQSNRSFPESGVDKGWHAVSHHGNDPATVLEYHSINTYRMGALKYLLEKLRDTKENGAPLLDRTAVVWGSAMGDPNLHNHRKCPLVLMGKANGALEGNVHVRATDGTPMANAFVSLLRGMGHDLDRFGDSMGALPLIPPAGASPASTEGGR